jgi:hypothetical protein
MRRIGSVAITSGYILSLLDRRWRNRTELAILLHCHPSQVHHRILALAKGKFTVVRAGDVFATLPKGWLKKDLMKLIYDRRNTAALSKLEPQRTSALFRPSLSEHTRQFISPLTVTESTGYTS